jgi:hypothetical protein
MMNGGFIMDHVGYHGKWAVVVDTRHRRAKLIMLDELCEVHECGSVSGLVTMHHTHFTIDDGYWCTSCTYLGPYIEWMHKREKHRRVTCMAPPGMFSLYRHQKLIWTGKLPCGSTPRIAEAHAPDGIMYIMVYGESGVHILKFIHDIIVSSDMVDGDAWLGGAGRGCSYDSIEFVWADTCLQITHRGSYVQNSRVCMPAF